MHVQISTGDFDFFSEYLEQHVDSMRMREYLEHSHARENVEKKMAEVLLGGKRLNELKVTELKAELDKRGLPKKGVKSVLV